MIEDMRTNLLYHMLSSFFGDRETVYVYFQKQPSLKLFKDAEELGYITITTESIKNKVAEGFTIQANIVLTEKGKDLFTWYRL